MPSSSDVEDTTHLISPRFSLSSTSSLISLPRELWWTSTLSSPLSLSLYTTLSAPDLVLVKTRVVSCWSMRSFSMSYIIELTMSEGRVVMSAAGQITFRSSCFLDPDSISATSLHEPSGLHPTRYAAMDSIGASVADSPILTNSRWQWYLSLSSVNDRKAPLLESQMSWISSRMTHSTFSNASLNFGADRMSARLSGVVMRMWGGWRTIFCLSLWGVSPERTATRMSGTFIPRSAAS